MIHYIESNQIIDEVIKNDKLVIIDFFADWCMPCQMQTEVLHEVENEHGDDIEIYKINVEENQDVSMRYGITAMPTIIFFKDGEEVERKVGLLDKKALEDLIDEFI